ncbi:antitoxin Xre/MbcA/ParS toxin-binding domain-containing protein [Motilimonas sp. KMU-193]|uniref:MbcA/ParS/Xre antitoxin family protein n=1 Tax=Motilimonas sp. KMU-193 TaxID=3388668 RepID=UPI00396B0ECE
MSAVQQTVATPEQVLAKALLNVGEQLALNKTELAAVIGIHRTGLSRLTSLDPKSKQGELALLLIRLARALYASTGGDKQWMRHFMQSHNKITRGVPKEQIKSIQGLMTVLRYLDGIRGKL